MSAEDRGDDPRHSVVEHFNGDCTLFRALSVEGGFYEVLAKTLKPREQANVQMINSSLYCCYFMCSVLVVHHRLAGSTDGKHHVYMTYRRRTVWPHVPLAAF